MNLYISTNMYGPEDLPNIFPLLAATHAECVGIELFPEWHDPVFSKVIEKYGDAFSQYPISLHGPYYRTEHSKPIGSKEYLQAMDFFQQTLQLSQQFHSKYIVYHHNNCRVAANERDEMVRVADENLKQLSEVAKPFGAQIVVENAGVLSRGNMLFDEAQFIQMAQEISQAILIDIGHAHANGWNLERLIEKLAHKTVAYHVHNNDGREDQHNRILDGTLDFDRFLTLYKKFTPQADIVIEYGKHCAQDTAGILADAAYIREKLR
ncbi:MAG: sugar phosphate isomerase/epimerase [Sporomusaceae bacterium]|nr:sugar phosphate isomerase/epimerase [Sporomusaceae bacterium]